MATDRFMLRVAWLFWVAARGACGWLCGMTLRARLALAVLFVGQVCYAEFASTRLAVWSNPAARDEAALLTVELTARARDSGYELLDRDELARFVNEQSRDGQDAVRAGRLAGAAGVVWIEETSLGGEERLIVRLGAVASGLVAGWRIDVSADLDRAAWAVRAARQLEQWRPRLAVPRAEARAVTLLNLRRAGASGREALREQTLTLVLGEVLAQAPRLRVLERWRLDDLALEAVLGGAAQDEFWRGASLLDGSFTEADGEMVLSLRLRPAADAEQRWTVRGGDAGKLVEEAAAEVARRLLSDPFAGAWDRAAEAREFLDEARWAARWNLQAKVVEAAEAAIVLGGDTPELRRLRYLARGRLVWGGPEPVLSGHFQPFPSRHDPRLRFAAPPLEKLMAAREVLELFAAHRARPDGQAEDARPAGPPRMPGPWAGPGAIRHSTRAELDAVELLGGAARVLAEACRASELDAARAEAAAELRRAARETFAREREALGLRVRPRAPGAPLSPPGRGTPFGSSADGLLLVAYARGAWWTERLAEHQELVAELLSHEVEGEPEQPDQFLRLTTPWRAEAWEVDWATRDATAARAQWAAKAREWMASADLGLGLGGALQLLALNSLHEPPPLGDELSFPGVPSRFGGETEQAARVAEAVAFLAGKADDLASGRLPAAYLTELGLLSEERVPEAAREAWARLRAARASGGSRPQTPVRAAPVETTGPRVKQAKLPMRVYWLVPEARVPAVGRDDYNRRRGIRWADRSGGCVRVISEQADATTRGPRFVLSEIALPGFRETRLGAWTPQGPRDFSDHLGFPAFAIVGRRVFAWEGGELWSRNLDGGAAARVEVPVTGQARLWALGGRLYVAVNEGGILRVDPESGSWEMLADSRRRPAEGLLDDRRRYQVERMWLGADGAVRVCATTRGEQVFRRDEARRSWVLEAERPHANLAGYRYQRAECVAWLEDIEMAAPGHGRAELERLLNDTARAGDWRTPDGFSLGEHFFGDGQVRQLGGMTRAGDVWAVFHFWRDARRPARLVWMPAPETGHESLSVELEIPAELFTHLSANSADMLYGGIGGEQARFLPGPEGLAIYATGSPILWFISKARLEASGLAWAE